MHSAPVPMNVRFDPDNRHAGSRRYSTSRTGLRRYERKISVGGSPNGGLGFCLEKQVEIGRLGKERSSSKAVPMTGGELP
jgi:hypothetical protein